LKYLRGLPESVKSALMIGHNPGLHDLALALAEAKSRKRLPPAEGKFRTGAMATFRFDGAWKELRSNGATVLSFTSPKEVAP
jgi:phosphohistidine phosphatase